jgi:antitoxin component of RelBE/YafQ-DinJ toxin-antitoxin module
MEMAKVVISNVDESVKQNFERFCTNVGMNTSKAFSALVEVGIIIHQQGLLLNTAEEVQRQIKTKSQRQGEALSELMATLKTIDNEPLDAEFDEIVSRGVALRGVDL